MKLAASYKEWKNQWQTSDQVSQQNLAKFSQILEFVFPPFREIWLNFNSVKKRRIYK